MFYIFYEVSVTQIDISGYPKELIIQIKIFKTFAVQKFPWTFNVGCLHYTDKSEKARNRPVVGDITDGSATMLPNKDIKVSSSQ